MAKAQKKLGEILVEWGFVQPKEVQRALEHAKAKNMRMGEALLELKLCIENHIYGPVDTIARVGAFLERFDSPALKVALAPIHTVAVGESLADALRTLAPRIGLVYAWDVPKELTGEA